MEESNKTVSLVARRYIWKEKDNDKLCVKIVTGVAEEHLQMKKSLFESEFVEAATSEYVCEYDLAQYGVIESIKKMEVN